jgi:caffeoyl-CoA O-methyltransferase
MNIVEPAIERYISSLRGEVDPVVLEMEQLAERRGFPIVGPQVGQLLGILARALGARRVLELGSGFGYSAYWFARALAADGIVHCTDTSEANRDLAQDFLGRAGLAQRIRFQVGDALELTRQLDGPFDLVFNDVDKEQYPAVVEPVVALLRPGGLFITDNVLWKGRVAEPGEPDDTTAAVLRFNTMLHEHPALETCILPLRDGLAIAVKR